MNAGALSTPDSGTAEPDGGSLAIGARRTALIALTILRLSAVLVVLALGSTVDDPRLGVYLPLAAAGALAVAATSRLLWREERTGSRTANVALWLDGAFLLVACALSGGGDSPVLLVFMVMPLVAALVLRPWPIVIAGFGIAAGRIALGGEPDAIAAFLVEGVWATVIGVVAARGRAAFWRRLDGLDAVWSALVPASAQSLVRQRVADELRIVALEPLTVIRAAAAAAVPGPDGPPRALFTTLAERVRSITDATRAVVYELHGMSGLTGPVDARLRQLAMRRAPGCTIDVDVDDTVPEGLAEPLGAVVRDALALVVGTATRVVTVRARSVGRSVRVEVAAGPASPLDRRTVQLRWAALTARPGVSDATLGSDRDGRRIDLRLRGLALTDERARTVLGRDFRDMGPFIAAVHAGFVVVGLAVPLLVGGAEPAYWFVAVPTAALMLLYSWVLRRPRRGWIYVAMLLSNLVLLPASFAFAGTEAQLALLPAAIAFPVTAAVVFRPVVVGLACAAGALALALLGETTQPAMSIAAAWAVLAGVVEASVRARLQGRLFEVSGRRLRLLTGLLVAEDAERRRLALQLHDDVLQLLLVARQDLEEAGQGDAAAVAPALEALDLALASLGRTASELDVGEGAPAVAGGLADALALVAVRRDGPPVSITVDPVVEGIRDGLLAQLTRELYVNAAKHAEAGLVHISVRPQDGGIALDVRDDGVGFDPAQARAALDRGHIGLATVRERVAATGGRTDLRRAADGGTHVAVWLPPVADAVNSPA
ncbi:hypothetical protein DSM112329_04427 [Paraconexibacter sp. AEG42_29]|uniref:Histidine kinase domain-containing protein n=1 Tax=Paraconexibacter sp. AEG42_29 TaxID=2997339 RepID=A0AAU7B0N6_9ACTN